MGQNRPNPQNPQARRDAIDTLDILESRSSSNARWGFLQLGGLIVSGTTAYFAEELIRNGTTFTAADLAHSQFGQALRLDQTSLANNVTELLPLFMAVAVLAALYFAVLVKEDVHSTMAFEGAARDAGRTAATSQP